MSSTPSVLPHTISKHSSIELLEKDIDTCITVIAFKRPSLLTTTLAHLSANRDIAKTPLYIYIDGARKTVLDEQRLVSKTVESAHNFIWDGPKTVIESDHNRGLSQGVRYAINQSLQQHESTVIIEDDIITSPFFFRFMKKGLIHFWNNPQVASICGNCYNYDRKIYNPKQPYFLRHFACWGWATWRSIWCSLEWDAVELYKSLIRMKSMYEFNFGVGDVYSRMLIDQIKGRINTWDIQAGASMFLKNQLCLFPPETLTNNIGWRNDGQGTHKQHLQNPNAPLAFYDFDIPHDISVQPSKHAFNAYNAMYYPHPWLSYIKKIIRSRLPAYSLHT